MTPKQAASARVGCAWLRVTHGWAVYAVRVEAGVLVEWAPYANPIVRRTGRDVDRFVSYVKSRGAAVEVLP